MVNIKYTDEFLKSKKWGRLTFIKRTRWCYALWLCDCGREKEIKLGDVIRRTKSCGCLRNTKNGQSKNTLRYKLKPGYHSWEGMKRRCKDTNFIEYENYGAKGITYDPKWETYEGFREDMGEPKPGETLDRNNNKGNYTLSNCSWKTVKEQNNNKKKTIYIKGKALGMWASELNISINILRYHHRKGDIEQYIEKLLDEKRQKQREEWKRTDT